MYIPLWLLIAAIVTFVLFQMRRNYNRRTILDDAAEAMKAIEDAEKLPPSLLGRMKRRVNQ